MSLERQPVSTAVSITLARWPIFYSSFQGYLHDNVFRSLWATQKYLPHRSNVCPVTIQDRHSLEKAKKELERKQRYRVQSPTKEGDTREAPSLSVLGPGLKCGLDKINRNWEEMDPAGGLSWGTINKACPLACHSPGTECTLREWKEKGDGKKANFNYKS